MPEGPEIKRAADEIASAIKNLITRAEKLRKNGMAYEDYRFRVYRRDGLSCYKCGTAIEKGNYSGRAG